MIRTIKFTSIYEDSGDEVVRVQDVDVAQYGDDYLDGILWPLTGTGRPAGDACYFAESVDDLTPAIRMEWC